MLRGSSLPFQHFIRPRYYLLLVLEADVRFLLLCVGPSRWLATQRVEHGQVDLHPLWLIALALIARVEHSSVLLTRLAGLLLFIGRTCIKQIKLLRLVIRSEPADESSVLE